MTGTQDLHGLHGLCFYEALPVQATVVSAGQRVLGDPKPQGSAMGGARIENPLAAAYTARWFKTASQPDRRPPGLAAAD